MRFPRLDFDLNRRRDFLIVAIAVEGGLIGVASLLGWLLRVNPFHPWRWDLAGVVWGVGGAVPIFAMFLLSFRFPIGPLRAIREFLIEHLGPILARCRWYDLILLAALAGLGEEILFRGLLQPLLGLYGSNAVFGLLHAITPTYALLAGLIGLYLGWLRIASDNLLAPVLTHAVYDYLAFLVVVAAWRSRSCLPGRTSGNHQPSAEQMR